MTFKATFSVDNCISCGNSHSNLDIEKFEWTDDGLLVSVFLPCKNSIVDIIYNGAYISEYRYHKNKS